MSLFGNERPANEKLEPASWIHAHCDGGSRGNPGPSGFGALITDGSGAVLAELSDYLGIRTNNYAEYSGLLAVLAWALENGHLQVKLVSDSELMVKQIQGKYKVNSPDLKPLWQQAKELIAKLDRFEISHALRHKNKEADALANQAMDRGTRRTVISHSAPPAVRSAAPAAVESLPLRPRPAAPVAPAAPKPAASSAPIEPVEPRARLTSPTMLRGFTKDGTIHLLGGATLPDGVFVKIIRE